MLRRSLALALGSLLLALCAPAGVPVAAAGVTVARDPFPVPSALRPDVAFWTRVYTEVSTESGLLHDSRDLSVVYEVTKWPHGLGPRARERFIETRKKFYKRVLERLARGRRSHLNAEEGRVLELFKSDVSNSTLRAASRRVRFQLGQADKFRAGLVRSGAWADHIRGILHKMGLPEEIAALPHVESSFTPYAYSRVGAAGLWQFTRSTGRRYLRVDHVVDERLDPYKSSAAAARLLEQNRRVTGSWPLAITAYNHGAAGMRRAVRKLGTHDITTIVRKYRSRTFGFASRNFYVEFLAASHIAADPERYFGSLQLDPPIEYDSAKLPFYARPSSLASALGLDLQALRTANPALRPSVWRGTKYVPRGFELRAPRAVLARPVALAIEDVASSERLARQTRDLQHIVRRGETLSGIAARYGVSVAALQAENSLRSRHRIRTGQRLRLPVDPGQRRSPAKQSTRRTAPSAPPADGLYHVRRGDTLSRIATRFTMSERDLMRANGLRDRNRIYVGQVLRVARAADTSLLVAQEHRSEAPSRHPPSHPQALARLTPARSSEASPEPIDPPPLANLANASSNEAAAPAEEGAADTPPTDASTSLLADPSDYTVASDGSVEIQVTETLGHYAEWLGLRAQRLRVINHLRYGEPLGVHTRLELDFSRISPAEFERRRLEYHRVMQEEFFEHYEITGTHIHRMRRGESLWELAQRRFDVPLWLLQQYNPDADLEALVAGTRITVPVLEERESALPNGDSPQPAASAG